MLQRRPVQRRPRKKLRGSWGWARRSARTFRSFSNQTCLSQQSRRQGLFHGRRLIPIENFKNITYILKSNGWTIKTILAMIIFYVNHFPCATTLLTIKKETGNIKYMLLAFIFPTLIGFLLCFLLNFFVF